MEATVIIGTFGNPSWHTMGCTRAGPTVEAQTVPTDHLHIHGPDLASARNQGAAEASTDWICFLDADDQLDPGYIEAMLAADGDIRRPATRGYHPTTGVVEPPVMIPRRPILEANFVVIGALVRRDLFLEVGGFDPTLPCLEDWDLWIRMTRAGATIVDVPDAVYQVTVYPNSRNQNPKTHAAAYTTIRRRYR